MTQPTLRQAMNRGKPLVFGHRGAMAYAPMNTFSAFEMACQQGADGMELERSAISRWAFGCRYMTSRWMPARTDLVMLPT